MSKCIRPKECNALLKLFENGNFLCFEKRKTSQIDFESTLMKGNWKCKIYIIFIDMCPNLIYQMSLSDRVTKFELELHIILFNMIK